MRRALGAALGLALGFALARAVPGDARATAPARPQVAAAAVPCVARLGREDLDALKAAVGSARAGDATAPLAPAPEPPVPQAPGSQALAASQRADELVDQAIAAGVWSDDDVTRFRALVRDLSAAEDRERAVSTVVTAINAQRLRPDSPILF